MSESKSGVSVGWVILPWVLVLASLQFSYNIWKDVQEEKADLQEEKEKWEEDWEETFDVSAKAFADCCELQRRLQNMELD